MSIAQRIASDVYRLKFIPLPADITGCVIVTCRELKQCGWSDDQIQTLSDLVATESTPCSLS